MGFCGGYAWLICIVVVRAGGREEMGINKGNRPSLVLHTQTHSNSAGSSLGLMNNLAAPRFTSTSTICAFMCVCVCADFGSDLRSSRNVC